MATIDQQFVEYIVKTLVNNPDKVVVERTIDEKGVLLALTVDPEDVGRVIGKRGVTAQSIRTLLRALGTKNDARYNLKIVNDEEEDGERRPRRRRYEDEPRREESSYAGETQLYSEPEAPAEEAEETVEEEEEDEAADAVSDFAERTRSDLEDYDDLDI